MSYWPSVAVNGYQCVHFTWASKESYPFPEPSDVGMDQIPGPAGENSVFNVPWYLPIPSSPPITSITFTWDSGNWGEIPVDPTMTPNGDASDIVTTDAAYTNSLYRSQNIPSVTAPKNRLIGFYIDDIESTILTPLGAIQQFGEGILVPGDLFTILGGDIPSGANYLILGRHDDWDWRTAAAGGFTNLTIDWELGDVSSSSESSTDTSSSSSSSSAGTVGNMGTPIINQSHNNLIPFSVTVEKGRESDSGDEAKIGFEIKASNSEYFDYEAVVNRDNSALTSTPSNDDPTVYVPEDVRTTYEHRNSFYVDIIAKDASGIKEVRTHVEPDKYEFEEPGNVFYIPRFTWE